MKKLSWIVVPLQTIIFQQNLDLLLSKNQRKPTTNISMVSINIEETGTGQGSDMNHGYH
jgi:hypothetical protein